MPSFEFRPLTDSKIDILKDLSDINSLSKLILNSIKKIKENLKNSNCENRELSEKHKDQLKLIEILYNKFKKEKYSDITNANLKKIFNIKNIDLIKLDTLENKTKKIIFIENKRLKDNYIFSKSSFRDNIEKNLNFKWEYIETKKINEFFNLFTIEYINLLDRKKRKYPNIENSKLYLSLK